MAVANKMSANAILSTLDATHGTVKPIKKKKKKLSGDARRRAKKRKLQESGVTTTTATTTTSSTASTIEVDTTKPTKKPKKRNRKNAKCKCSRCQRSLQKKNLKKHLEHCDGTRPTYDPKHIPSHIREIKNKANASTDDTLAEMFTKYCETNNLAGSDDDFALWSESMLANASDTMQSVNDLKSVNGELNKTSTSASNIFANNKKQRKEKKIQEEQEEQEEQDQKRRPAFVPKADLAAFQPRHESTGKKKTFEDEDDDDEHPLFG